MFCEECGTKIDDGLMYCPNCGTKVGTEPVPVMEPVGEDDDEKTTYISKETLQQESEIPIPTPTPTPAPTPAPTPSPVPDMPSGNPVFCPHCGAMNNGADLFCANCGGSMDGSAAPVPHKKSKLPFVIGGIAAAFLVVVIACVFMLVGKGGGNGSDVVYYIKDESLCRSSLKRIQAVEVDEDLLEDDDLAASAYINEKYSANERYMFYCHVAENGERSLYYIDTKDKNAEPQKIDSDIQNGDYDITPDNRVVYCKNGNLYIHDLKDKQKIASDISHFELSDNGEKVIWLTSDGDSRLYVCDTSLKEEKEKLDSEIDYIFSCSANLEHIIYVKEGSIYIVENLGEKEKVASDVGDPISVSYSGNKAQILYYEEESEGEDGAVLWDFVTDDMSDDEDIEEPREEDYQTTRIERSWGRDYEVTETDDEYYEKQNEYYEKLDRDSCRENLKTYPVSVSKGKLTLYDSASGEKQTIAEGCLSNISNWGSVDGNTVVTYYFANEEDMPKLKFSEVYEEGIYSAEETLYDSIDKDSERYLAYGETVAPFLDEDKILDELVCSSDKLYAVICEQNSDGKYENYELGEISLKSDELGSYTKLYADAENLIACENGDLLYGKDYDSEHNTFELYMNEDKIDSDVAPGSVLYTDNSHVVYTKDMEDQSGTLKLYNGKESKKVADDVRQTLYFEDNKIVVLVDFSKKSQKGDLKLYNGKELEKIDTDVSRIVMF